MPEIREICQNLALELKEKVMKKEDTNPAVFKVCGGEIKTSSSFPLKDESDIPKFQAIIDSYAEDGDCDAIITLIEAFDVPCNSPLNDATIVRSPTVVICTYFTMEKNESYLVRFEKCGHEFVSGYGSWDHDKEIIFHIKNPWEF